MTPQRIVAVESRHGLHPKAVSLCIVIDPRAVDDLAADLGLGNDVDLNLLRLPALGQIRLQERTAEGDLVVDARLTLLRRGKPGVNQGGELLLVMP